MLSLPFSYRRKLHFMCLVCTNQFCETVLLIMYLSHINFRAFCFSQFFCISILFILFYYYYYFFFCFFFGGRSVWKKNRYSPSPQYRLKTLFSENDIIACNCMRSESNRKLYCNRFIRLIIYRTKWSTIDHVMVDAQYIVH